MMPDVLSLDAFDAGLRRACTAPSTGTLDIRMRPFASRSPDPRDCRVMVVGINPAKPLDFWDGGVWNSRAGFDWQAFVSEYPSSRSRTRGMLEHFACGCFPHLVLESNVYAVPSKRLKDLDRDDRNPEPFRFLVREIPLAALVVHGKPARTEAIRALGLQNVVLDGRPHLMRSPVIGRELLVAFVPHFAKAGWSHAGVHAFGVSVAKALSRG